MINGSFWFKLVDKGVAPTRIVTLRPVAVHTATVPLLTTSQRTGCAMRPTGSAATPLLGDIAEGALFEFGAGLLYRFAELDEANPALAIGDLVTAEFPTLSLREQTLTLARLREMKRVDPLRPTLPRRVS